MTPKQCRAGRALLDWEMQRLAREVGVSRNTVSRFERGEDALQSTVLKMQQAMEKAGVEFLPDNGVRLPEK